MVNYCEEIGELVDGVELTTPRCDLIDVPDTDTDHTANVVAYISHSLKNKVGIQDFNFYSHHSTDN